MTSARERGFRVEQYRERYQFWLTHPYFDEPTRAELAAIGSRESEIEDRFYRHLEFGTGGLRGVIGSGTNRINRYVVRQATAGLARYIAQFGADARERGVVIAHDSRRFSPEFAREAALTLAAAGVRAYLWDSLRPTPMLSFAVRRLRAIAGIVVTASHNPPEYNGYKVYWEDGGQVPPERAAAILEQITAISDITAVAPMEEEAARAAGLLQRVPAYVDRAYYDHLAGLCFDKSLERGACRILYSPLHGSGNIPVTTALREAGYQVSVVPEQEAPDPNFSTVKYPNPEEAEVFTLALQQAEAERPDVIMATDPDADRLGVLARDKEGRYRLLTGNQIGAILVDYIIAQRREMKSLPANGAVIKTIATSNLVEGICRANGVTLINTHTGFKFIGDRIREFEEQRNHTFLFGFEESYGYLGASFVRDKDAVMAALLVAEAVAYHKRSGRTLYEALEAIWAQVGCYMEGIHSVTLPGKDGLGQMAAMMADLRANPPHRFGPLPVAFVDDYKEGTSTAVETGAVTDLELGQANVLHYRFADGGFVMVRPSGTEPKLKIYFSVAAGGPAQAQELLAEVRTAALRRLGLI